jgi:Nucleotidyltransferase
MHHTPLPETAARHLGVAVALFNEFRRVRAMAKPYAGSSMYWKRDGTQEYLVRTRPGQRSHERIGLRSAATERLYAEYSTPKAELEGQLKVLRDQLVEAEYQNKRLRTGRAPAIVVTVLRALDDAGLHEGFTAWGVHALYAYEAAARVQVGPAKSPATWFGDAARRLVLVNDTGELDACTFAALRRADRTFERASATQGTAVNARGFEVRLVTGRALDAPLPSTAPRFEHPVVAATGRMAWMRTLVPAAFVSTVRGCGEPAGASHAHGVHADCVQALLDAQLLRC